MEQAAAWEAEKREAKLNKVASRSDVHPALCELSTMSAALENATVWRQVQPSDCMSNCTNWGRQSSFRMACCNS